MPSKSKNYHFGTKLISNTFYLFLDWFAVAFFSFIFWLILGKTLNPSNLGIVATAISLTMFIGKISNLGINIALQKLIPEIKQKKGLEEVYSLVKLSLKPISISLLIIFLILLFFSHQFLSFIKIPYYTFLITIFSIIIFSIYDFLASILYGLQNMKRLFLTNMTQIILRISITGLLVLFGFSYFGPLIGFLFGYFFILFFMFNPNYFKNGQSLSYKKLFFYAAPALISTLASAFTTRGGYIILTIIQNTETTGIFTVAFTITSTIGTLIHASSSGLFPITSALSADKKRKKKQGYLIGLVLRYSIFLTIPLALLLLVFPKHAVLLFSTEEFWSTEKFLDSSQLFTILVPAAVLFGIGGIFTWNLYALGQPKLHRNIIILSSLVFLILSLILTNYFSALGLSISYLIAVLLRFILGFGYIRKHVKLNLFIKDILKVLISSLAIISILLIFKPFIYNVFILGIILFPTSLLYLGVLLLIKFYKIEDVKILRYFGKKLPNLGKYILSIADFIEERLN